jgi:BlaI family transcriptional regulator, penicillinase repressor
MNITAAETAVMNLLWQQSPRTSEDLLAELMPAQNWSEATVRTLIGRLVKKKAVAADLDGRRYLYRPLVKREAYALAESQTLIDRLFDGRVSPFLVQFSKEKKLSKQDLAELKQLIAEMDDGG